MKLWRFRRKKKYGRGKGTIVSSIVGCFALMMVGMWVLYLNAGDAWKSQCALEWNEVPALVTGHYEKDGRYDDYVLYCEYVYGNTVYATSDMGYGKDTEAIYRQGMKDGEVPVYVNPDNPSEAVMSVGITGSGWLSLGGSLFLACIFGYRGVCEIRVYRRRFCSAEYIAQTVQYLEGTEPRSCQWRNWESLDGVLFCLSQNIRKYIHVAEAKNPLYVVTVCTGRKSDFCLVAARDIDQEIVVASPDMVEEDVKRWFESYEQGEPLGLLIADWKEV